MVKQLFNNPWFVCTMAGVGLVYFAINVIWPALVTRDAPAVEVTTELNSLGVEMIDEVPEQPAGAEPQTIGWLQDVPRDPFAMPTAVSTRGLAVPRLRALFIGDRVAAAILNDRLVRVGDSVADFRVTEIAAHSVTLMRDGRTYVLEPEV
ncbi:MAG: hypothetical protein AAF513_00360 [Pseudomonadota bacterium]